MGSDAAHDVSIFAETQLNLLQKELEAEREETADVAARLSPTTLERSGLAITNLHISTQKTGLGGRTVLELELDPSIGSGNLPEHGIRTGDIVAVQQQHKGAAKKKEKAELEKGAVDGVVVRTTQTSIAVALDKEDAEPPEGKLWLSVDPLYLRSLFEVGSTCFPVRLKLASEVTYKRMNLTMERLRGLKSSDHTAFMHVVFGKVAPSPVSTDGEAINWITDGLNDSQKDAIKFAIGSKEVALIHGPPGTGKTHTLIELILQLLKLDQKLLVCGPSNISVDNIVERLASHKVPMVRLGHPARLLPSVLNHSLDVLTRTSDAAALVQDIRKEMDQKQASIRKTRSGRERKAIYMDMKDLRREYRQRERGCVDGLIRNSAVVLATLHGAGGHQLRAAEFDVVIIDEASQALEAQCWVPLIAAKKAILAGDHLQLPPTIKSLNPSTSDKSAKVSKEADKTTGSLETTMFDRLLSRHGSAIKRMLTVQYRMHRTIMQFPSQELYDDRLTASEAVASRLLCELPYDVESNDDTIAPLVFYDTQGGDFLEEAEDEAAGGPAARKRSLFGDSKSNAREAAVAKLHVASLAAAGVAPADIAVITPYNAQLTLLSKMLRDEYPDIELGSVDGFQGREKEAVVLSLVRSNEEREVGFLGEKRRLNVAMTRPKRQLCVIGDSDTISKGSKFLARWMKYLEEFADLRYPTLDDVAEIG